MGSSELVNVVTLTTIKAGEWWEGCEWVDVVTLIAIKAGDLWGASE